MERLNNLLEWYNNEASNNTRGSANSIWTEKSIAYTSNPDINRIQFEEQKQVDGVFEGISFFH